MYVFIYYLFIYYLIIFIYINVFMYVCIYLFMLQTCNCKNEDNRGKTEAHETSNLFIIFQFSIALLRNQKRASQKRFVPDVKD